MTGPSAKCYIYIMRQPTYLASLNHLKEILPNEAGGLNVPFSSLKKKTC